MGSVRISRLAFLQAGLVLITCIAAGVPFAFGTPTVVPDAGLGSPAFLQFIWSVGVFVLLLVPLAAIWRMWAGDVPNRLKFAELEAEWGQVASGVDQAAGDVQKQLNALKAVIERQEMLLREGRRASQAAEEALYEQVRALENDLDDLGQQVEQLTDHVTRTDV